MSDEANDNPGPARCVTAPECFQRHEKIDLALWGEDGRGGIVKDIGDIKNSISSFLKKEAEEKTKGRDWRLLGFAILGSVLAGFAMAALNYVLGHLP